jgi:hypothetical protein
MKRYSFQSRVSKLEPKSFNKSTLGLGAYLTLDSLGMFSRVKHSSLLRQTMQNSEKTFGYRAQASEAKNGFEKKRFFP